MELHDISLEKFLGPNIESLVDHCPDWPDKTFNVMAKQVEETAAIFFIKNEDGTSSVWIELDTDTGSAILVPQEEVVKSDYNIGLIESK